jgi:beta-galactosidase
MERNPMPEDRSGVPSESRLHLGAAYYPEHWPEERWPEDIRLMREAGFTVVRMGEFAWSAFEPAEGEFHFDWLERAISMLAEAGIVSVLGTPTAAPPAWLTQTRPDTLAVDEYGRRVQHGNRCQYCVTSPDFHTATRRIVAALAERFGQNPHVIGWQLDNEYNRVCYCERCRSLFQQYLAEKFGTLEALNAHWSTAYWSQTYSAWEQIPIPIGGHNPGLMLAFKQFVTECYRRFQRLQLDVLRPRLRPGVWVTHNFMGWFDGFDHYVMAEDLDLASWDWYVRTGHHDYLASGATHDLTRGFKRRNFWVMETQPGCVNWLPANNVLNKGEARAMAWHAVTHGADAILYWQWRSALNGQEQYHGSLLDQSGQPRPFYEEVQQLGREFAAASSLLVGSSVAPSRVAILNCYDSRWSIQWQRHHDDFDYVAHLTHYYRPLAARNIPVDVISADAPLKGYRLVIAPALLVLSESRAERLKDFVAKGGHLVLTIRCGMKDEYNALLPARQPGPLAEIAGVEVEEYYALQDEVAVSGRSFSGVSRLWAERLKIRGGGVTIASAQYAPSNGWLDGQPAVTVHSHGHGLVYYVGVYFDEAAQRALVNHIARMAGAKPVMESPQGVEVRRLVGADGKTGIFVVINHEPVEQVLQLPWPAYEHLNGLALTGKLRLAPYGVVLLTRAEKKAENESQPPPGEARAQASATPTN